jgi:hypothetical protein
VSGLKRSRVTPQCCEEATRYIVPMKPINRKMVILGVMSALGLSFLTVGCERTVSRTEESKVKNDGTVESKEKKVTENPDGTVTRTETKRTDKP